MAPKKRLGKKHRQAATRPKKGRAPRVSATTGAVTPRKRKLLSTKRAQLEKQRRTPTRSPENETRHTLAAKPSAPKKPASTVRPAGYGSALNLPEAGIETDDLRAWERAESVAAAMHTAPEAPSAAHRGTPLRAARSEPEPIS